VHIKGHCFYAGNTVPTLPITNADNKYWHTDFERLLNAAAILHQTCPPFVLSKQSAFTEKEWDQGEKTFI